MKNVMRLVLKEDLIWEQTPERSLCKARLVHETITVLNKRTQTTLEQRSVEVFCAEPPRCQLKKKTLEPRNSGRNRSIFVENNYLHKQVGSNKKISAIVGCHTSPCFRGTVKHSQGRTHSVPSIPFLGENPASPWTGRTLVWGNETVGAVSSPRSLTSPWAMQIVLLKFVLGFLVTVRRQRRRY